MKSKALMSFLICMLLAVPLMAAGVTDHFETPRDFLTEGTSGTIWDGFIGRGKYEVVDQMNASMTTAGVLRLQSTNGRWQDPFPPSGNLGPLLYKNVKGDFIASVKVAAYEGTAGNEVWYNAGGLMARVGNVDFAGAGEDWIAVTYFPEFNVGVKVDNTNDGSRAEQGIAGTGWGADPYLQIERRGNLFYCRTSSNGMTWTNLGGSPFDRSDMDGLPVQVGMWQCTYIATQGYMEFDDFHLISDVAAAKRTSPVFEQGATTGALTLNLTSGAPTADVAITAFVAKPASADPNDPNSIVMVTNSVTFTPADWDTPKTMTYQAIDDDLPTGPKEQPILFKVTSTDLTYDGGIMPSVSVRVIDNDAPDVILTTSDSYINVAEGGVVDTLSVALSFPPTADVTVAFVGSGVTVTPAQLVFTPANYAAYQTATVTANDDGILEWDPHSGAVQATVTSADAGYNALALPAEAVIIGENECGAWGILSWDRNKDCVVNLTDFAELAGIWMGCSVPYQDGCVDAR